MRARSWLGCLAALLLPCAAGAGALVDMEIYDRSNGRFLPTFDHEGRFYVAGEPNHRYELRLRNRTGARVLAVVSIDGVNVVSGETAAEQQSGYVIDPWDSVSIEGWRKSLDDVAAFYFTRLRDSYAARTGRPDHVGVIGVALFREAAPCCTSLHRDRAIPSWPAPAAENQGAAQSADGSTFERRAESKMGTGHGERETSHARYVDFQRSSETPDERLVVYYDSTRNLRAQGIIPRPPKYALDRPNPFPNGFVPDP